MNKRKISLIVDFVFTIMLNGILNISLIAGQNLADCEIVGSSGLYRGYLGRLQPSGVTLPGVFGTAATLRC